jgi:hypothetical protein
MKKIIFSTFILASLWACKNGNNEVTTDLVNNPFKANGTIDSVNVPKFQFETDTFNFGTITQGEKVTYTFRFTNVGKGNLIISAANGSCGCTVPEYPKKPIAEGEKGEITVTFDSEGKSGMQQKTVTIVANTYPNQKILYLVGNVLAPTTQENN